jgi:hypothetical protein
MLCGQKLLAAIVLGLPLAACYVRQIVGQVRQHHPSGYKVLLAAMAAATIPLVVGCVNNKPVYTADGQVGHSISCTPGWTGGIIGAVANANTSWATCYEKAGELCGPAGYDVIQQTGEGGVYGQGGNGGGFVSTTNNRSMIVKCKGAAPGSAIAPAAPAPAMAQQK